MKPELSIAQYAVEQLNRSLTRLAFEAHRAAKNGGRGKVDDLRTAAARFSRGLLLFREFFPKPEAKKIGKRLRHLLAVIDRMRERDLALEFLAGSPGAASIARLRDERKIHEAECEALLRSWAARDFSAKWRAGLSLKCK